MGSSPVKLRRRTAFLSEELAAPATAPDKEPHAAPCIGVVSCPCAEIHSFLRPSYIGNWMNEKGISRATVVQYPV